MQTADDPLKWFQDFARGLAETKDDEVFRRQFNYALMNMGLFNQAQQDAMQMKINSDPNLKGQGAGTALLSMMARDQNFNMDDLAGKLSIESAERIRDLNKWGFEAGLRVDEIRRNREDSDIQTLLESGNFSGASQLINNRINASHPGLGIQVDPQTLQGRDPHTLDTFETQMGVIERIAKTNPAAATAMLQTLMNDPRYKDWFPSGATAQDMVGSMSDTNRIANLDNADKLGNSINALILSGKTFDDVSKNLESYFSLANIDPIKKGKNLSLEQINELRHNLGLTGDFVGLNGTIVDENGIPLDDEDFKQLGYQQEYSDRKKKSTEAPWQKFTDMIWQSEWGKRILANPDLYPAGKSAIESYVQGLFMGGYTVDPNTGMPVPKDSGIQPWDDPKLYWQFYSWPTASFDAATGNVQGNFDLGGDAYGDTINGQKVVSGPADEILDEKFRVYARGGGGLTAQQWYFATSGGTRTPDESKIPSGLQQGGTGGVSDPVDKQNFMNDPSTGYNNLTSDALAQKLSDTTYFQNAIRHGIIKPLTTERQFQDANNNFWSALASGESKGWTSIGGKAYQVKRQGSGDYTFTVPTSNIPGGGYISGSFASVTGTDGKQYILALNVSGSGNFGNDGVLYPLKPDGLADWSNPVGSV